MNDVQATAVAVPTIQVPEGADIEFVIVVFRCGADEFESLAQRIAAEHDAKREQRFDVFTGAQKEDTVQWQQGGVHYKLEAQRASA